MAKPFSFDLKILPLACSLLELAVSLSAVGYVLATSGSSSNAGGNGSIEVTATAQEKGTPDTLSLQLAVMTNARSSAIALNRNDTEMRHLQAIFRDAGVASSDLQTNNLSVGPTYNENGKVNGYQAEDDLGVTLHDIARSGAVIDSAENAVGNDVEINSISFSISSDSSLLRRASVLAMQQARAQAEDFARGGNEVLGSIVKVSQVQSTTPQPLEPVFNAAAGVARSPVPIRPGTEQVSVEVDVVYRLLS